MGTNGNKARLGNLASGGDIRSELCSHVFGLYYKVL